MPTTEPHAERDRPPPDVTHPPAEFAQPAGGDFRASFGEDLAQLLDLQTWRTGWDPTQEYPRIEQEVRSAVEQETEAQRQIRRRVFPLLAGLQDSVPGAGVYSAEWEIIRRIHQGLLLNGGVEACDGTVEVFDTLPLTVYQVGVSLVSYRGDQGTWHQRLFRRDLRHQGDDPAEEAIRMLRQRGQRAAVNHDTASDALGALARKAIMDYAERAVLLHRSSAVWRMGHGNPITYELLTGADNLELMLAGTGVVRELVEKHPKFVYVASEPREALLLTIGHALLPMSYAIVDTLGNRLQNWFHQQRFTVESRDVLSWDAEMIPAPLWIPRFLERVASRVVVGVYRATAAAPAQLFYAHADHAHLAAHIVLADSMFQEERGFPLLIDLADHVCRSVFGGTLRHLTESALAAAGAPWRYLSERDTRDA